METQKLRPSAAADSPPGEPTTSVNDVRCTFRLRSGQCLGEAGHAGPHFAFLAPAERVYRIEHQLDGGVKCKVLFVEQDPSGFFGFPLHNCRRHSPTGFECGYAGSGPAELAFSILFDFFYGGCYQELWDSLIWSGPEAGKARAVSQSLAEKFHQDFKRAFITLLSLLIGEIRDITAGEIARWLAPPPEQRALGLSLVPAPPRHLDLG